MISSASGQTGLITKIKAPSVYRTLPWGSRMSSRDPRVRRHLELEVKERPIALQQDPVTLLEKLKAIMEILKPQDIPLPPDNEDEEQEQEKDVKPSDVPLPQDSDSDSDSSASPSSSSSSSCSTSSTSISSSEDEDEDEDVEIPKSFSGILHQSNKASTSHVFTKAGQADQELVRFAPKHREQLSCNFEDQSDEFDSDDDTDDEDEVTLFTPPVPYTGKGKGTSPKRWSVDQLTQYFAQMSLQDCPLSSSFGKLSVSRKRKAPQDENQTKKSKH